MCRSTDYRILGGDRLKIKAFFVRFSHLEPLSPPPESLTLFYLPRIDETDLEIDGLKIRPDSPAFVTLHRVVSSSRMKKDVVFGSRERVRASEGVQFQVYLREEKVVQGIFRKSDDGEWRLECRCTLESEIDGAAAGAADVCVDVEGQEAMCEKVVLEVRRKKRRGFGGLEEIPEGREVEGECEGCGCCCGDDGDSWEDDGGDDDDEDGGGKEVEMEMEVEGVRWAVDLGIWAVCLGVGYLVSRAAQSKTLRRKRIF